MLLHSCLLELKGPSLRAGDVWRHTCELLPLYTELLGLRGRCYMLATSMLGQWAVQGVMLAAQDAGCHSGIHREGLATTMMLRRTASVLPRLLPSTVTPPYIEALFAVTSGSVIMHVLSSSCYHRWDRMPKQHPLD